MANIQRSSLASATAKHRQRGAAAIVGVIIIVILLIVVVVVGYFALTADKQEPALVVNTPKISADDLLTAGKTNNELLTDTKIIEAGYKRDEEQRKAAEAVLNDEPLPVGGGVTSATTVESERLSQLQTEYINEADRRIGALAITSKLLKDLTVEQRNTAQILINDETTALTGLKAKAAAETTREAFLADRTELEKEYINFTLAQAQVRMWLWANDQTILGEKVNVLGGKFQERINDASNSATSTAKAQTLLNSYQTNKTSTKDLTAKALVSITEVAPNTFNANRPVLKSYYDRLASSHNEIEKAMRTSTQLTTEIRTYR